MASSIFMGAAGKDDELTIPAKPRRKSSKAAVETHNKKPRQRGMGVEKLERLRIEERWKEITQINNTTPPSLSLPYAFMPTAFADPHPDPPASTTDSSPRPFAKFGVINSAGGGLNLIPPEFSAQNVGPSGGAFFPSGQVSDEKFQGYRCGVENVKGNSKELHSISNHVKFDQYCADFYKGAKVVALHRKENTTAAGGGGNNLLMEYEFFPRGNGAGNNELVMMMNYLGRLESDDGGITAMSIGINEAASCVTTTATTSTAEDDASTCIDLSLKLSY